MPTREGLENKWWHRLIVVLIYSSTIFVFLFIGMNIFNYLRGEFKWKSYNYTYSFEKEYSTARGKEENCDIRKTGDTIFVSCGNIHNKTQLLNMIAESKSRGDELVQKRFSYVHFEKRPSLSELMEAAEKFDNDMVLNGINNGDFQDFKVKIHSHIRYLDILSLVSIIIMAPIGWLIFFYSILYRTALYVIYGSSK
jgi:hypothetical protein